MDKKPRLIDADTLCEGRVSNDPVVIAAKCAPAVEAVPVVRCRECQYRSDYVTDDGCIFCRVLQVYPPLDGYCHCGTKMEGGPTP